MTISIEQAKSLRVPATREEFETALDGNKLFVKMGNSFWQVRRNGKTQTWSTRPTNFRVPVKCGLRETGQFHEYMLGQSEWRIND